ncbi:MULTISPECIES: class 1a ribonucleoside-diphosphate reductase subunit alpha [Pseudoalteromonas]|jgi:ribonucleoside-diphosphate reductase alpha chain|uniref:Ribonucleoside-diphosphate reductase n=2 Tax=Pseudoalteromonas tetraodonis TaxID=43659 RepID=A0AA37S3U2_9GAMM|nr:MULTISPECIES: class 1a ribonucleoside-diphosphate reductase subunit alpha [Pseudoalteromonas]ATD03107.1 ribonucleoside-diphosphate reductase alpha chain [Pseudoalteromonas tetraodonis]MDN3403866.1 class 1a ribonucleoside-diphosphate reductase subunit alpha [Pseudoalteromonas sp. APC 3218]MDN3407658.1 class 1a ribonucleoside-diphosphate reductase subunit alpha [Pseudoalteromonas sp. APC 3894]MDN3411016.1 class 1a ribonucleoside-diphosphate reductase subunit alpha [Pseudoalteromonas sp. APC 32|tara:strand:+ start:1809 stop:4091 length:2283 start_codon:yes stop_codon:yes gene_type:complete
MNQQLSVSKRDGRKEPLDLDKIHRVIEWAAEGLNNVSVSQVELKSHIQFYDGIRTKDIHETIIKAAADQISKESPDYQYLAARLAVFHLRKKAYGQFEPPRLFDHVTNMVEQKRYDAHLLVDYTEQELDELDAYLDHSRDLNFSYAAVKQLEGKYLVQNRVTGEIYESAQFLYILVAASLFSDYPRDTRIDYIKRFYDAVSLFKISLPTPIMSGVRTPTRQFSSCVLIECGDSLDSINATSSAIVKYVSQRAGIGINAGRIRALGSPIRNGEAYHTGCIPFYKHFQTAVKSCSQGGVRGGAATLFYPLWHLEVENLLVLKNNRGVDDNRVRHLDYGVQFNKLMYSRLIKDDYITLFSPSDVPGLYDAFFEDQDEFDALYVKYEQDESIRKKRIKAIELFSMFAQERASTGRIYLQNVDHCNTHSPFISKVAPIRQSNLCLEIALPTKPLSNVNDEEGEIALCTLSAFNLGAIESLDELEELAELAVRALDNLLDFQDYPVPAAKNATMGRRTLGIGVINYAYYLAKNGKRYSDGSANALTHRTFEAIQYYLMKASNELAKERGACPKFNETTYSQGIMPTDTYKRDLDKICDEPLHLDWDALRSSIKEHGMRNSTLSALMPSETSSQISNATNGIEPPRGHISVKASKDGILKQVVPEYERLKDSYELLWDIPSNDGYLQLVGIMQKFIDQTISANTNYDPNKYEGGRVPMKVLLKDLLGAYKLGVKTLYYHNTRDGASDAQEDAPEVEDDDCAGGACKI